MSTRHTPDREQANNYSLASGAASGVILAGGLSRRLGRDKALVSISDQPLIQRVIERVEQLSQEILVVVADQNRAADLPLAQEHRVVLDR